VARGVAQRTGGGPCQRAVVFVSNNINRFRETKPSDDALIENVQGSPPRDPKLAERYRAALRAYIDAARSLAGLTGPEFEEAYRRAEEARVAFEHLRGQLQSDQSD